MKLWAKNYVRILHACLLKRNIQVSDFGRGLERLAFSKKQWLPTQGEFVEMCEKGFTDYGMPDLESAWIQAQRIWLHKTKDITEAHPCFNHMATNNIFYVYGFKQAKAEQMGGWKKEFELAMNQCLGFVRNGQKFGEVPKRLQENRAIIKPTKADIEQTKDARAFLMEQMA